MEKIKLSFCVLVLINFLEIAEAKWKAEGRIGIRIYRDEPTSYVDEPLETGGRLFSDEYYNKSLSLVILIHGMDASIDCEFVEGSVKAMFFRGINKQFNIIALNLPELMAKQNVLDKYLYTTAINSKIAGNAIGDFFEDIIELKHTSPEKIHVIGYSMGAQVAGYLARKIKNVYGQIQFIMGLDPAGIGFTPSTIASWYTGLVHVSAADAKYTQFMHCNSVGWGTLFHNATANFVFNGGNFQPGCMTSSNLGCSHNRVPFYFIESILYPMGFLGQSCESWKKFLSCDCLYQDVRYVTFPPDLSARGNYYLRTKEESAFGLGEEGIKCFKPSETNSTITENIYGSNEGRRKRKMKYVQNEPHSILEDHVESKNSKTGHRHRRRHDYERMVYLKSQTSLKNHPDPSPRYDKLEYKNRQQLKPNVVSFKMLKHLHNDIIATMK